MADTHRLLLFKLVPISRFVSAPFHSKSRPNTLTTSKNGKNYSRTISYRLFTPFRSFTGM